MPPSEVAIEHPSPPTDVGETANDFSSSNEGVSGVDLTFIEEPLGLMEEQSYGFPQLEFGQRIGPTNLATAQGRYKIAPKLGFGRNSSVWLAYDER